MRDENKNKMEQNLNKHIFSPVDWMTGLAVMINISHNNKPGPGANIILSERSLLHTIQTYFNPFLSTESPRIVLSIELSYLKQAGLIVTVFNNTITNMAFLQKLFRIIPAKVVPSISSKLSSTITINNVVNKPKKSENQGKYQTSTKILKACKKWNVSLMQAQIF